MLYIRVEVFECVCEWRGCIGSVWFQTIFVGLAFIHLKRFVVCVLCCLKAFYFLLFACLPVLSRFLVAHVSLVCVFAVYLYCIYSGTI